MRGRLVRKMNSAGRPSEQVSVAPRLARDIACAPARVGTTAASAGRADGSGAPPQPSSQQLADVEDSPPRSGLLHKPHMDGGARTADAARRVHTASSGTGALIPWQIGDLIRRLVKTTNQVETVCQGCGLAFHDTDAGFCKKCGKQLII